MKEIQVASGRGQYYGNPIFTGHQPIAYQGAANAPLAVDEQYSRASHRLIREISMESTYESQHTQQRSISEEDMAERNVDDEEDDDEEIGFGGNIKRKFLEVLRRRSLKEHDAGANLEGLVPGNLQTLKAVAALAAVAGGMGGGAADPDKTAANG